MSENRMETYFNIRYEFDRERVFRRMDEAVSYTHLTLPTT